MFDIECLFWFFFSTHQNEFLIDQKKLWSRDLFFSLFEHLKMPRALSFYGFGISSFQKLFRSLLECSQIVLMYTQNLPGKLSEGYGYTHYRLWRLPLEQKPKKLFAILYTLSEQLGLSRDFLIDGRRSLIWSVRLGG